MVNCLLWYAGMAVFLVFRITSGVRQGSSSPALFSVFINIMVLALCKAKLRCHLNDLFVGCIFYADDILLMSPSVLALQRMLDICQSVGSELSFKI